MNSECSDFQRRIPQSFVGELSPRDQEALERHLDVCTPCREEHRRYAETLSMLQATGDEPVPRHFFVYPQESFANPWQLFRQLTPRWQAASLGFAAMVVIMITIAVAAPQIRYDRGAWTVGFGRASVAAPVDLAAFKAEILAAADNRSRDSAMAWIQSLRNEIGSRANLSQEQQIQTLTALTSLETRLNNRISTTADEIRTGTEKANVDLYQAVSAQREQDINRVNTRLDRVIAANDVKAHQTEEILDTLIQIVSNLKQTGEQK
jgi:hypothetical protein